MPFPHPLRKNFWLYRYASRGCNWTWKGLWFKISKNFGSGWKWQNLIFHLKFACIIHTYSIFSLIRLYHRKPKGKRSITFFLLLNLMVWVVPFHYYFFFFENKERNKWDISRKKKKKSNTTIWTLFNVIYLVSRRINFIPAKTERRESSEKVIASAYLQICCHKYFV